MKTVNLGLYIVSYNLVIGILLMLASEKISIYAGYFMGSYKAKVNRLTLISVFTFGSCVAAISAGILIAFYLLKL
jgi:hypothetical protein